MKRTTFYPSIWMMTPYNFEWFTKLDDRGQYIKELILNNTTADALGISEMHLNITKFSAIDDKGNEHYIKDFPMQSATQIKGMKSGHFMKSSSVIGLQAGTYKTLRYYLGNSQNRFILSDGKEKSANNYGFLDFEIQDGLILDGQEVSEVKLWFEFTPYNVSPYFKKLKDWFNINSSPKRRMTRAFN